MKKIIFVLVGLLLSLVVVSPAGAEDFCPVGYYMLDRYEVDAGSWLIGDFAEIDQLIYSGDNLRQVIFHLLPGDFTVDVVVVKAGSFANPIYYNPPLVPTEPPTPISVHSTVQQGISNFSLCATQVPTAIDGIEFAAVEGSDSNGLLAALAIVVFVIFVFATGSIFHNIKDKQQHV